MFSKRLMRKCNGDLARDHVYGLDILDNDLDNLNFVEAHDLLNDMWADVLARLRQEENVNDEDLIRIHLDHPSFNGGAVKVNLRRFGDMTPDAIASRVEEVSQIYDWMLI